MSIEVSVQVKQDVGHTWEYYFNQINLWWPNEYLSSPYTKRFVFQTYIGGLVYEDFGEGDGLIWGEVIGVNYLKSLVIRGNLIREYGGPAITFEKFVFEEKNEQTQLIYTMDFVGPIEESSVNSLKKGWEELLLVHFKNYCVSKE